MSTFETPQRTSSSHAATVLLRGGHDDSDNRNLLRQCLQEVAARHSAVWPLRDYVAVNPFVGLAEQKFLDARRMLRLVSDQELLMSPTYYREQFESGSLQKSHVDAAIDELVADGVRGAERIDVHQVMAFLRRAPLASDAPTPERGTREGSDRVLRSFSQMLDDFSGSDWDRVVLDEISKHCAAHYDAGQAMWTSPWKHLSLYGAWRARMQYDANFELRGISEFRRLVEQLPDDPLEAILTCLVHLGVPREIWADWLLCESQAMPGWTAWVRFRGQMAEREHRQDEDQVGLLAIRLAYLVGLALHFNFRVDWKSIAARHSHAASNTQQPELEELLRYTLLKASEIAFRDRTLAGIAVGRAREAEARPCPRALAQMVFCIDVRSERMRRNLEAASLQVETFGIRWFFWGSHGVCGIGGRCGAGSKCQR